MADYGWDPERERSFGAFRDAGLLPGRVVRAERGQCDVVAETGPVRALVLPSSGTGDRLTPCTGDWVAVRPAGPATSATVVEVLERRTAVVRSTSARTSHAQVLAANVDTVAVAVSLADPLKLGRIERMLALAWESGATPVVVLTKADRCPDPAAAASEVAEAAPGVEVLVTSATTGEGLDVLTAVLSGTIVLLGPSGAGKSTLGNRLLGEDRLATGAVRGSDGKGRHTTAWRELVPLPDGGVLLDTPGLRGVGLHDADDGLERTFAEITELARDCRFTDCAHTVEPGCAVLAAVADGRLTERRLDSYHRLERENAHAAARTDARLRAELERPMKQLSRQLRAHKQSPYYKA
ncbi:ribosome small subunit-dependent GTPase A [Streptomyces sp. OfavH-34-F]|uniref:ribosome small subunit-dependent GTPase A n=1 Tax=Streptomyces sp. OfavH-34-F TaxID=2917760 RepID=UPI001EF2C2D2|nr:ribosome small subunit-dependent GTPase A [Streptomyces sp. OfavH-34-F]MCG7523475.1 ribosome small subunit-dependent GTPase A [Streptomyces sp. OfavH-34-F]